MRVLQVVVSDEVNACNRNDKPFNRHSLIPSINLMPLLLYPTNTLTKTHILWKPVA